MVSLATLCDNLMKKHIIFEKKREKNKNFSLFLVFFNFYVYLYYDKQIKINSDDNYAFILL